MSTLAPIFAPIFAKCDAVVLSYIGAGVGRMAAAVIPIYKASVALYITGVGLLWIVGKIPEPISDTLLRLAKIVVIGALVVGSLYSTLVVKLIYNSPGQLAAVMMPPASGDPATSNNNVLDNTIDKVFTVSGYFIGATSMGSPVESFFLILETVAILFIGIVLTANAAALIILAKLVLALCIPLGLLTIALALWRPLRQFLSNFVGVSANYVLVYGLVAGLLALAYVFFDAAAADAAGKLGNGAKPDIGHALPMIIIAAITIFVLKQVGGVASSIAGGLQLSTAGAVGGMTGAAVSAVMTPVMIAREVQRYMDRQAARDFYAKQNQDAANDPGGGTIQRTIRGG